MPEKASFVQRTGWCKALAWKQLKGIREKKMGGENQNEMMWEREGVEVDR